MFLVPIHVLGFELKAIFLQSLASYYHARQNIFKLIERRHINKFAKIVAPASSIDILHSYL